MNILLAEDDVNIRAGLVTLLESEGYRVIACADGDEAIEQWQQASQATGASLNLVLLDIMMPGRNGYDVCREIRTKDSQIPVIFISAKSEEIDRVVGLELGADDFIMKPFGVREVLARIRAVTRRCLQAHSDSTEANEFQIGPWKIFPTELRARKVHPDGRPEQIELSLRDIEILKLLVARAGQVVSRDELYNAAWGRDYLPSSRSLDQHISKLRKLIEEDHKAPRVIQTVHGAGFRYEV